eukprot:TRINITY_DN9406_c0_g1_i1.p1 TRINITY_DN9406_c0_g1~~TRINITY_DN9406_c0_g1_i1.p1  ORF type:complete len:619 (+),score=132.95 TRINITY_DN9406_c0_g1_i1:56-1912(+)
MSSSRSAMAMDGLEEGLMPNGGQSLISSSTNGGKEVQPVQLQLREVTYTIPLSRKSEKQIIFGVDADFLPGRLSAIMGPSGAGKTTLLNMLTLNAQGRIGGSVLANGRPIERGFKQIMNIVPQEDVLLPALTVRETLRYAASLRMPAALPSAERDARAEAVIKELNLDGCAGTIVGSVERRGISGGQRKRVSVGLELLTRPSVLFLDEPTSGLDSKAAEDICSILRDLAGAGHTVVCTVHQPSWKLFATFDDLLLLAAGRAVYRGLSTKLPDYFSSKGFPAPPNENPVDHAMRVIQEHPAEQFAADFGKLAPVEASECLRSSYSYPNSFWKQVSVLFRRNVYDFVKDSSKFLSICAMKLTVSLLVGICWWQAATPAKALKSFTITGVMFMFSMNCLMDNLFDTVMRFPLTKQLFLREYKNGCYSSFAWYIAYMAQVMLFQIMFTLLLVLPAYFMVGLRADRILVTVLCLLLASCIGMIGGLLIGVLAKDLQSAQSMLLPTIVPLILFCGYVIPRDDIPDIFRWVYYIDIFQFSFTILRLNQFDGWVFSDCPAFGTPGSFCMCMTEGARCTGNDFLITQDLDPATHHIGEYFGYMLLVLLVLLLPSFLIVRWKANQKTG